MFAIEFVFPCGEVVLGATYETRAKAEMMKAHYTHPRNVSQHGPTKVRIKLLRRAPRSRTFVPSRTESSMLFSFHPPDLRRLRRESSDSAITFSSSHALLARTRVSTGRRGIELTCADSDASRMDGSNGEELLTPYSSRCCARMYAVKTEG